MIIKTDHEMHATFLRVLRSREKSLRDEINGAQAGLDAVREAIAHEEDYLNKESPCEPSKPSASDVAPTAS